LSLGVEDLEPPARRREVREQLTVERGDLVSQLKELVLEPPLG
jgi:hypothetical protein